MSDVHSNRFNAYRESVMSKSRMGTADFNMTQYSSNFYNRTAMDNHRFATHQAQSSLGSPREANRTHLGTHRSSSIAQQLMQDGISPMQKRQSDPNHHVIFGGNKFHSAKSNYKFLAKTTNFSTTSHSKSIGLSPVKNHGETQRAIDYYNKSTISS